MRDRKMQIVIVGRRNEKPVIRWAGVIPLAIVLSAVIGFVSGFTYRMLSGQWDAKSIMLGAFGAITVVGGAVVKGLKTPLSELRILK
jgi:hypothetical protein